MFLKAFDNIWIRREITVLYPNIKLDNVAALVKEFFPYVDKQIFVSTKQIRAPYSYNTKGKNLIATMYYYWNKISDYLWGASKDLYQRLHACEIKVDLLTKCLENLYRYNNNKMEDTSKLCVGCGECESEIENDIDEEDDGYHEDCDSDGSNLGVFIKPRINDNTQLQYITGKQDRYNMRKILYSNMENIVDRKEAAPRKKLIL